MRAYTRRTSQTIAALKRDRAEGMAISDLVRKYGMSKTGIWHHIREIDLSDEVRKSIRAFRGGSRAEKVREWERARIETTVILQNVNILSAWPVLYAALYWSEGTKSSYVFTNTDERMIQVFLVIARTHLGVQDEDLDFMIRTCAPMDPLECKKHWATVAGVAQSQIRINHHDKHNRSHTRYGICRITLKKGAYQLKLVHCLFNGIADKILAHTLL